MTDRTNRPHIRLVKMRIKNLRAGDVVDIGPSVKGNPLWREVSTVRYLPNGSAVIEFTTGASRSYRSGVELMTVQEEY